MVATENQRPGSELVIPGTLPTMNEIIAASKRHHMQYSNLKNKYTNYIAWKAKAQGIPTFNRVDAVITWYCKDKRKDPDNIRSGEKFLWDGLVKAGILANDGWSQINNVTHQFEVDRINPRVVMSLCEVSTEEV